MTPTEQAARVLADVQIQYFDTKQADTPSGRLLPEQWMPASEVVAAIARHLAPGDDLVERATAALSSYDAVDDWGDTQHRNGAFTAVARPWIREAAARISALTRERDLAVLFNRATNEENYRYQERARNAEAEAATLRDRLARMEGAIAYVLDGYGFNAPDYRAIDGETEDDWITEHLRAALTDGGSNG